MSYFARRIFRLYWVVLLVLFASGCGVNTNRLFTQDDLPRLVLQPPEVISGRSIPRITPDEVELSFFSIGGNRPTGYYGYTYVQSEGFEINSYAWLYLDATDAANTLKPLVKKLLADPWRTEELSASKIDGLGEEAYFLKEDTDSRVTYVYIWRASNVILVLAVEEMPRQGQYKKYKESDVRALADKMQKHTR